jgi:hypothetical protein
MSDSYDDHGNVVDSWQDSPDEMDPDGVHNTPTRAPNTSFWPHAMRPTGPLTSAHRPPPGTKMAFGGTVGKDKMRHKTPPAPPSFQNVNATCAACAAPAPTQVCIGCGAGFYCNVGCQRQHWPEHKSSCGGGK